jgi:hypothetical protein
VEGKACTPTRGSSGLSSHSTPTVNYSRLRCTRSELLKGVSTRGQKRKADELTRQMGDLNRCIKDVIKSDYEDWVSENVEQLRKKAAVGEIKAVYEIVKKLSEKMKTSTRVMKRDIDKFKVYFKTFFGKSKESLDEDPQLTAGEGFRRVTQILETVAPEDWSDVDLEPPTLEELKSILPLLKDGKAVGGIFPSELLKCSEVFLKIVLCYLRKIWTSEIIPDCWLEAAITLIKKSGNNSDPKNFRPVSLTSLGEKLLSVLILERIKPHCENLLSHQQAAFRRGYSVRHPLTMVLRRLENSLVKNEPICLLTIDLAKAFDNLSHKGLVKALHHFGTPQKITNLIEQIYYKSKLNVKINGELTGKFTQKRGIRQGSALSPILFVLCLDVCLKATTELVEERFGVGSLHWEGYADDITLFATTAEILDYALKQLQSSAWYFGLHLNCGKCEVMSVGVKTAKAPKNEVFKERTILRPNAGSKKVDSGGLQGWLYDIAALEEALEDHQLSHLTSLITGQVDENMTHLIVFDEGPIRTDVLKVGGSGQAQGKRLGKVRLKSLGKRQPVRPGSGWYCCTTCDSWFTEQYRLRQHLTVGKCAPNMTVDQQAALAKTRAYRNYVQGVVRKTVENVAVKDILNRPVAVVESAKILGTVVSRSGRSAVEVARRIAAATAAFQITSKVLKSPKLTTKLKLSLYGSLVQSVLMYNLELLTLSTPEEKHLARVYNNFLKHITRTERGLKPGDKDREASETVLGKYGLPAMNSLLTHRRLKFIGHVLRQQQPSSVKTHLNEFLSSSKGWARLIRQDLASVGLTLEEAAHSSKVDEWLNGKARAKAPVPS